MRHGVTHIYAILIGLLISLNIGAQCPGALDCTGAEIKCALNEFNGFTCSPPPIPNPTFPTPNLCFGSGSPHSVSWWAFVGNGQEISIAINYEEEACELEKGLEAGIIEGSCDGSIVLDCNTDCSGTGFTLSGQTRKGRIYSLWVDGCEGDFCSFTIAVLRGGSGPRLLRPMPKLEVNGPLCACSTTEICFPGYVDNCLTDYRWSIDSKPLPLEVDNCIEIYVPEDVKAGEIQRVCLTVTVGNPLVPSAICDQDITCIDIELKPVPKEVGQFICIPRNKQPYIWHGQQLTQSCINPPCSVRIITPLGCCIDSIKPIKLLPVENSAIVKGSVYADFNGDCRLDPDEVYLSGAQILMEGDSNSIHSTVDSNGYFEIIAPFDNYLIRAFNPFDSLYGCPDSVFVNIDKQDSLHCHDFLIKSDSCYGVKIGLLPLSGRQRMRCDGGRRYIRLEAQNSSSDTVFGDSIILTIDRHLILTDAEFGHRIINDTALVAALPALPPGTRRQIKVYFKSNCSISDEGRVVSFSAKFLSNRLCHGNPIAATAFDIIRNSFDPNDLTVIPYGVTPNQYISEDTTIFGTIRFHNLGTDTAYDIRVELNILSPGGMDETTFQLLGSSEPSIVLTRGDRNFTFQLFDAKLPHDAVDSVNSHGYIKYSFNTKPHSWDPWLNQGAEIFFDHHPGIQTNVEKRELTPDFTYERFDIRLCYGDDFHGRRIFMDSVIVDTIVMPGPDRVVTTHLIIEPTYLINRDTHIFNTDTFKGQIWKNDTIWTEYLNSRFGCDSLINHHIDVSYKKYILFELCQGDVIQGEEVAEKDTIISFWTRDPQMDTFTIYDLKVRDTFYTRIDTTILLGDSLNGLVMTRDTVIRYELTSSFGCDSTIVYNVDVSTTGIKGDNKMEFSIYPNPMSGRPFSVLGSGDETLDIELLNVRTNTAITISNSKTGKFILPDGLASGIYFYRIRSENGRTGSGKLVIL